MIWPGSRLRQSHAFRWARAQTLVQIDDHGVGAYRHGHVAAGVEGRRLPELILSNCDSNQELKEAKNAIRWTRLSCLTFRNNAVRLRLHALAYNLGNFLRTLALPKEAEYWSLTTLREKLVKIVAKVVSHGRYVSFQLAEVAVARKSTAGYKTMGEVRLDDE